MKCGVMVFSFFFFFVFLIFCERFFLYVDNFGVRDELNSGNRLDGAALGVLKNNSF